MKPRPASSLALTALSALLYAAAFPPVSAWPVAWVALAPLLVVCGRVSPRLAALHGALWSALATVGVAWWFPGMVGAYFDASTAVGWAALLLAILLSIAGYYALFAAWVSWLMRRQAGSPLLIACGWGVTEFARERLLTGNGWGLIGYSQVPASSIIQVADLAGPYGVGMLLAAVNVVLAGVLTRSLRSAAFLRQAATVALLLSLTMAYGHHRIGARLDGPVIDVAVMQGAATREYRWKPEYTRLGFDPYLALTREAVDAGVDLIVWPEQAVNFYIQEPTAERVALLNALGDFDGDMLFGGARYANATTGVQYFNSVFLAHDGLIHHGYDKHRLLPVAEAAFFGLMDERLEYTPGRHLEPIHTGVGRIGTYVCFETLYPELVRSLTRQGADLLVNVSNDVWFGSDSAAELHLHVAAMRAIENRRFVLRASSMGPSAIIDPMGHITRAERSPSFAVIQGSARALSDATLYGWWGDTVTWVAAAFAVLRTARTMRSKHDAT